jgi:hypothetical protein
MVSAILFAIIGQQNFAAAKPPVELTESTFAAIRTHASPTPEDLAFQNLDWKTTVFDGILAGQKEDKPLIMWMYFGDPRGHC